MKKLYIYSTLSADVLYQNSKPGGADMPVVAGEVLIRGGAGIANDRLITPRGVATEVTEEQVAILRENGVFKTHEANGFVEVSENKVDADVAAADMTGRDQSAPIVPQDLPENGRPMGEDDEPATPVKTSKKR